MSEAVIELPGPIRKTNRFFIAIKSYGHCDENGKVVMAIECSTKKIPAPPDRALKLIQLILEDIVFPSSRYSSDEAMRKDLQEFKEFVAGLEVG